MAYILLSSCCGSCLKGQRKRDWMVRVQPFFFWWNLPWAEAQYILLTGCKQFLNACVCCAQVSFSVQCVSTERDCMVRVWPAWVGTESWGGSVMAVSHLFWNNGWSLQLSLPRIALDSFIPLMHCAIWGFTRGILEMLLNGCGYILYTTVKQRVIRLICGFLFSLM